MVSGVFPSTDCFKSGKYIKKILLVFLRSANCQTFEFDYSSTRNEDLKFKFPDSHKDC